MSPAEYGRAIKICGAVIGLVAIVLAVSPYTIYAAALLPSALLVYIGFPYFLSELTSSQDKSANTVQETVNNRHRSTQGTHQSHTPALGEKHIGLHGRKGYSLLGFINTSGRNLDDSQDIKLNNGLLRTSTPTNLSGYLSSDLTEMNRRKSYVLNGPTSNPGSPLSVLSPINGPLARFGSLNNKVQRRHSFNVAARPLSFAQKNTNVKVNPASTRTSNLFSPRLLDENAEHNQSNIASNNTSFNTSIPLPKVHRLSTPDDTSSSRSSQANQEMPRATQQSRYSLLGFLPRINFGRSSKPVMTDKNSSMNKVTVKIAPPERLNHSVINRKRTKSSDKEEKVDDILAILKEKRKRRAREEAEEVKSPGSSQAVKRRKHTEDSIQKTERESLTTTISTKLKDTKISPDRPRLKRRAIHDASMEEESLRATGKRPKKANICRANSNCNEFTASFSSSRKLRESMSRSCSQVSSRRSSLSSSIIAMDECMEQKNMTQKAILPALPQPSKLVQETDHETSSASIDVPSITSTPASSITGTLDEKNSNRSTPVKRLFTASAAFGANLGKDEDESEKPEMYSLKKESTVKRRQVSILVNSPEDFSKLPKEQYPISHEDLERDRKSAMDRVQKMLHDAQTEKVTDKERVQKSLFGETIPATSTTMSSVALTQSSTTSSAVSVTQLSSSTSLTGASSAVSSTTLAPVTSISAANPLFTSGVKTGNNPLLTGGIKATGLTSSTTPSSAAELKSLVQVKSEVAPLPQTCTTAKSSVSTPLLSALAKESSLGTSQVSHGILLNQPGTKDMPPVSTTISIAKEKAVTENKNQGFTFGLQGTSTSTAGKNTTLPSSTGGFSFGLKTESKEPLNDSKSTFGSGSLTTQLGAGVSASEKKSTARGLNFELKTPSTDPGFSGFGSAASTTPSFGTFTAPQSSGTTGFGQAVEKSTSSSIFGSSTIQATSAAKITATTTSSVPNFSLGQNLATSTVQSGFSFGQTPATTAAASTAQSAFNFGQSTAATTSNTTGFTFSQTGNKTGFSSGQTATTTAQSGPFAFGQSTASTQAGITFSQTTNANQSGITFGQAATSKAASGGFNFGQPNTTKSESSFTFGQSAPQQSVFGSSATPSSTPFGTSTAATTSSSGVFPFGTNSTSAPTASKSVFGTNNSTQQNNNTGALNFGNVQSQNTAGGFKFGTSSNDKSSKSASSVFGATTTTGSSSTFNFGQTQPSNNTAMFGSSTSQTSGQTGGIFGNTGAQAPAPAPTFGQPAAQPSANAFGQPAASKAGFDFSKSAGSAAFQFGGSSASSSNQPAGASGGFGFGQSTPAFGSPAAPGFGSPTPSAASFASPAAQNPGSGGMFNIGSTGNKSRTMAKARRRGGRR